MRILGPLGADVGGIPVELGAPRQRAVLALLIAARQGVVPVDRMAQELWRGAPPAKVGASVQAYVSNLRRLLEPDRPPRTPAAVLVTSPPGYALRLPPEAVDAWRFETWVDRARRAPADQARELLAEALGWWQGPPFLEHTDEAWAAPEVARLSELCAQARELAAAADLRTGHAGEAALAAEALVRQNPLREEGWRLLALAHWSCGRQADALSCLRRATAVLRDELGCDPGPALAELERAVLAQRLDVLRAAAPDHLPTDGTAARPAGAGAAKPAVVRTVTAVGNGTVAGPAGAGAAKPAVVRTVTAVDPAPAAGPSPAPAEAPRAGHGLFVGRSAEMDAANAAARAARRAGGVLLVTGEAGAGKSALLERFAGRLAEAGWRVVTGRCPQDEGAPPAWAWGEALGALARAVPPPRPDELAVLLHEPGNAVAMSRDEATAGRFRMHRALSSWLRTAAIGQPLAVLLEDLHHADSETLALLEAAAQVTGVPLLTVTSYRPAEVGEHLLKTLAQLAPGAPHRIRLGGLPPRDVATVVEAVCGGPVDATTQAALAARTGGNPFYVLESARLLASEGALVAVSEVPQGVRDVLRRRLALLSAAGRAAVRLAAVAGLEAEVALLVDAADSDEDTVLEGLDAAITADLLTEPGPGRVRFVHALVRDTVYTDLSGVRRARLHDRIARELRRHRPDDLAALAHHFARSGRTANAPLAVEYALRAAELAERRYAHDVAVELIQQALQAHTTAVTDPGARPERTVELLVRLLSAQVRAGATDAARHTRQRAVDLAVRADRDDLVAAVYGAWTEPTPWRSRLEGLFDRTALARLERLARDHGLDDVTRARVLQALVDAVAAEDAPRAREAAHTQLMLARAGGEPRLLASALMTSAKLLPHEEQGEARGPLVTELRRLAGEHDLPAYRWMCEHLDGMSAATRNDPDGLRRHTAAGLDLARGYRMVWARGIAAATSAMLAKIEGRFAEAEAGYAEADGLLRRAGAHYATGPRLLGQITLLLTQQRTAELEPVVRGLHEDVGAPVAVAHALVLARLGRLDEARAVSFPSRPVTDHLYGLELDYRSELAVLLGDTDTATTLIGDLLPVREQLAGAAGAAYATRPLAHARADLYRLVGEERAAAEHYALAERVALAWDSPYLASAASRAAAELSAARSRQRTFAT
ncbi:BTAD domain-containing putative transcriptional regulator [Streptomyces phaeofaciens]|uniref:BTAD domain-containing putative transcriptional regulator n=1 Tax=Streptomyces phaeofaciens TaxID=68254 RepID=UPI00369B3632